jgi:hypothetical protein
MSEVEVRARIFGGGERRETIQCLSNPVKDGGDMGRTEGGE